MDLELYGMRAMLQHYKRYRDICITMAEVFKELKAKKCKALRSIAVLTIVWQVRLAGILFLISAHSVVLLGRSLRWCMG